MTFRDSAARLAGLAGAAFGWSPDTFWRATPAELGVLVGAMTGEAAGGDPPDAGAIARLREMFPDG
ncbi:phage tail assembly chaperone [Sphingomonas sp. TX0543]|uniref:phage tail assembly chaperone n=1 Tax=unclassified Sphingomonas TaxID=196159 RepID=UPI0010F7DEAA|nr:phage tail assembly chaperone [Sphingomonas sp. 3P27F8]